MKPLTPEPPVLALRTGINLPAWVGMMKQGTPASIPQHACAHLENVYFLGGRILNRAGQAKVNAEPTEGCIEGIFDAGDIGAPAVDPVDLDGGRYFYFTGISTEPGFEGNHLLVRYDTVADTLETESLVIGAVPYFVKDLQIGSDGAIYSSGWKFEAGVSSEVVVKLTWGSPVVVDEVVVVPTAATAGFGDEGAVGLASVGDFTPWWGMTGSMAEDPGAAGIFYAANRYIAPFTGGADSLVYRDGVLDDTPVFVASPPAPFFLGYFAAFNGTVYGTWGGLNKVNGGSATIRKRIGASSWTNLTVPTFSEDPATTFAGFGRPIEFGDELWVPGVYLKSPGNRRACFLSIASDDTVTFRYAVPTSVQTDTAMVNCVLYGGFLYYFFSDPASGFAFSSMGRTNGVSFVDLHWDCTIGEVPYACLSIRKSGGSLWAIAATGMDAIPTPPDSYWILRSNRSQTDVWTVVREIPLTEQFTPLGDIVDLDT
jgi:hypothetical protein